MTVEIYSKPGCSLCDEAKAVLLSVRERIPFELVEVDIRSDRALFDRYKFDIPVIVVEGERAFHHRVDESALETLLRQKRAGTSDANRGAGQ